MASGFLNYLLRCQFIIEIEIAIALKSVTIVILFNVVCEFVIENHTTKPNTILTLNRKTFNNSLLYDKEITISIMKCSYRKKH